MFAKASSPFKHLQNKHSKMAQFDSFHINQLTAPDEYTRRLSTKTTEQFK